VFLIPKIVLPKKLGMRKRSVLAPCHYAILIPRPISHASSQKGTKEV